MELTKVLGKMGMMLTPCRREATKAGLEVIEWSAAERNYFTQKTAPIQAAVLNEVSSRGVDAQAALDYFKSQLK